MTAVLLALALVLPLEVPPLAEIAAPATSAAVAVRVDPPAPPAVEEVVTTPGVQPGSSASSGGRCTGWLPLLERYDPGWSTARMAAIMFRESRCDPSVRNRSSSATGLLQILASHCPWLAARMGTWCTRARLNDPEFNVAAAAVLYREQGMSAWSTS